MGIPNISIFYYLFNAGFIENQNFKRECENKDKLYKKDKTGKFFLP